LLRLLLALFTLLGKPCILVTIDLAAHESNILASAGRIQPIFVKKRDCSSNLNTLPLLERGSTEVGAVEGTYDRHLPLLAGSRGPALCQPVSFARIPVKSSCSPRSSNTSKWILVDNCLGFIVGILFASLCGDCTQSVRMLTPRAQ